MAAAAAVQIPPGNQDPLPGAVAEDAASCLGIAMYSGPVQQGLGQHAVGYQDAVLFPLFQGGKQLLCPQRKLPCALGLALAAEPTLQAGQLHPEPGRGRTAVPPGMKLHRRQQGFFPLFSVWICGSSNAAFSIYWMAANVIQIVQQLAVNWYFERQDAKAAAAAAQTLDD